VAIADFKSTQAGEQARCPVSLSTTAPDRRTAPFRAEAKDVSGPKEMLLFILLSYFEQ